MQQIITVCDQFMLFIKKNILLFKGYDLIFNTNITIKHTQKKLMITHLFLELHSKFACNHWGDWIKKVPTELLASRLRFAVSVLWWMDDEEVFPESLRTGLGRFAAGGGFNLSVIPDDTAVPSGFFTFSGPEWEELPSNTIRGLFLLWSLLELEITKQQWQQ